MPLGIDIAETDIDDVARALSVSFDDEDRREALRSTETCDIQACPGSGKTTLLVAKLALLARKWSWADRGICVLSHTNVARHEVEHRLPGYPSAHRLLGYPHFVGTIQTFVDRFLSLPSLRELGLNVTMVDNDRAATKAAQLIVLKKYRTAFNSLKRKEHTRDAILAGLRLEGETLGLATDGKIPGEETTTHKQLSGLKRQMCEDGVFRYDDMYAFAEKYVAEHLWAVPALRHRFPWVFVDEMQDTDLTQDDLLKKLFGEGCILQRFGDSNQAIFRGKEPESQTSFPRGEHLGLAESKRFGQAIADLATPLTEAASPQDLVGSAEVPSRKHTVFLFDDDTILQVLPAFGDLITAEWPDGLPDDFNAKAIGFRRTPQDNPKTENIPVTIGDYLQGYDSEQASASERPERMIGFVRKACHIRRGRGECKEATDMVFDAVLELLYLVSATDAEDQRFTKTRLQDAIGQADDGLYLRFKMWLAPLVLNSQVLSQPEWERATVELLGLLASWLPKELPAAADEFLAWDSAAESGATSAKEQTSPYPNIYRHDSPIGPMDIELSTIHGAKGQTHTATLVLETYFYSHEIKAVLPFLAGRNPAIGSDRLRGRMKRVFVAMTRPRELLCLALREDHVSGSDLDALRQRGLNVHDLTSPPQ